MKKLILQESIMSDLDAMAREHSDVKEFILAALSDEYFNLKRDKDTIEFLKVIFDGAHKDLDMAPMQVTEKKATYCGRCGHTHVKGTPCPRPFKEGLSPYGDDAYFVAPNKGKMKKEDILKAVKEVLAEDITQNIVTTTNKPEIKKALQQKGVADTSVVDRAKPGQIIAAEDTDLGHEDNEPHMIKSELYKVAKYALELYKIVDQFEGMGEVDFPAWWQAKITKATSMISSAKHYLEFELSEPAVDSMVGADKDSTIAEGEYMWKDQPKDRYSSTLRNKEMLNQVGSALGELTDLAIEKGQYKPHPEKGVSRTYTTRGIVGQLIADQLRGFVDRYEEDLKGIKILDKAGYATYEPVWKDKEPESIVGPDPRVAGSLDEKLDPVGHEDKDIDNDGDVDKTDKYLKKRRVKIGAAIAQAKKK